MNSNLTLLKIFQYWKSSEISADTGNQHLVWQLTTLI